LIGTSLGPYKILEQLGAGGMGEVYLGEDTRLGRKVAIKVLPEEYASDPERMARFEQEARAAAALNHPTSPWSTTWARRPATMAPSRVFFSSDRGGNDDIWKRRADRSVEAELVLDTEVSVVPRAISPDGGMLLFDNGLPPSDGGILALDTLTHSKSRTSAGIALPTSMSPPTDRGSW